MKKLYQVKIHTEEQLGLSGVRFLEGLHILDTEKDLEDQIREIYIKDYAITIVDIEFEEVTFNKYNIIIEEKKGYVIIFHNCSNGVKRCEGKQVFEEIPDDTTIKKLIGFYGAESATIEERF